jgi:hypothetical protein
MLNIDGYSKSSLELVNNMLYAEGQVNPMAGECGQKQKREQSKQARTPAQTEADKTRAQTNQGRDNVSSGVRSEAARKAAETRKRCKGGASTPQQPG